MIETKFIDTEIGKLPEEWSTKPLGQICSIHGRIGFRGYTKKDLVKKHEGAITYSPSDIKNQVLYNNDCDYISLSKYEESPEIKVFNGDILFCKTASIGKCAIVENLKELATINPQFVVLKDFNCHNRFLYYILAQSDFQERVKEITGGSTIPTMSQEKLKEQLVPIPKIEEQIRISTSLSNIDNLISSLNKLIEKKKNIKQGAMQQLLTGKIRIKGFSEPWIEKKLGSCCSIKARIGWQGLKSDEYLEHGDYYLITSTDIINKRINWKTCYYVSKERFIQDLNIQIRKHDVLVSKDGTIGKVAFLDEIPGEGTLNSGVFVIRSKDKQLSQEYLAWIFMSMYFDDFINKIVAGSTIVHLYQKDIVNFSFMIPSSIKEQEAISSLLSSLDNEISALESKKAKYESVKQGMMQQLLTGKIRLV